MTEAESETQDSELVELDQTLWRSAVTDSVADPTSRDPEMLPFHERSWMDFERAMLVVAEQVDGLRGVRLYGTPGQSQKGIDLYGREPDGRRVAYQSKRVKSFTPRELKAAVDKFNATARAVGATKLVVCVGCETDRVEISERLEALRAAHPAIEIDLYDRRSLSEALRTRPDLVKRLFGDRWAAVFCAGEDWPVPGLAPSDVLADALVRGPVEALGLRAELERAEELQAADPVGAAAAFAGVADALVDAGFEGFAARFSAQRAELLLLEGDVEAATEILAASAWGEVEAGGPNWDRGTVGRLRALAKEFAIPGAAAFVEFVDAIEHWYAQPAGGLEQVASCHAGLRSAAHSLVPEATLWLLETAIAERSQPLVVELAATVDGLLSDPGVTSDWLRVRLRTAKADIDGDWEGLLRDSRAGRLGSPAATLVGARYGRFCARAGRPADAEAEYQFAIQRACTAELVGEAAACVRSIVVVRTRYGSLDEVNSLLSLATDLDVAGRRLFGFRDALDAGASALAAGKLPASLRWYRTAIRNAALRGDLNEELAAHAGVAEVLQRAAEPEAAARYFTAAGSSDGAKSISVRTYLDLSARIATGPYWERAVALLISALQADLIPDEAVHSVAEQAIAGCQEPPRSPFGPQVHLSSWRVLAALAERLNPAHADQILDLLEPLIDRGPGRYRHEDDEHAAIVAAVLASHPTLEQKATQHLVRIFGQGDHFAATAHQAVLRYTEDPPARLVSELTELADQGDDTAVEALAALDVPHPSVVARAEEALSALLAREDPPPGTEHFGTGIARVAFRARVLDEGSRVRLAEFLAGLAEKSRSPEANRTEAVMGVAAVARHLPREARSDLFRRMMLLARSPVELSDADEYMRRGLHPLSTLKINLGWGELPRASLRAAALLAEDHEQAREVAAAAMALIVSPEERDLYAAAHAVASLRIADVGLDLDVLLAHPSPWCRQLAAVQLTRAKNPTRDAVLQLASDPDPTVRRALASGLTALGASDTDLATEVREVLRTDERWSVRRLARDPNTSGSETPH